MSLDELLKEIKTKSLKEQIVLVRALFETQKEFDKNSQEYRLRSENDL